MNIFPKHQRNKVALLNKHTLKQKIPEASSCLYCSWALQTLLKWRGSSDTMQDKGHGLLIQSLSRHGHGRPYPAGRGWGWGQARDRARARPHQPPHIHLDWRFPRSLQYCWQLNRLLLDGRTAWTGQLRSSWRNAAGSMARRVPSTWARGGCRRPSCLAWQRSGCHSAQTALLLRIAATGPCTLGRPNRTLGSRSDRRPRTAVIEKALSIQKNKIK